MAITKAGRAIAQSRLYASIASLANVIHSRNFIHRYGPVASCQDARVGLLVASFESARLLTRAPGLLVVSLRRWSVKAWMRRWTAAGLIRPWVIARSAMRSTGVSG